MPDWQAPGDIDAAIVPLCKVLNAQAALRTLTSCSGHGRHRAWVAIEVSGVAALRRVIEAMPAAETRRPERFIPLDLSIVYHPEIYGVCDFGRRPYVFGLELVIGPPGPTRTELAAIARRLSRAFRRH
jgi:hypothetical protein